MTRAHDKLPGPSLAQHFDAPDDYVGHFGWMCGYSADADFLGDAAERFTQQTSAQRAHAGRIALGVFLDPGNPAISLLDVPGLAHFPIRDIHKKPFRLLHAKIALLGFRHKQNRERWLLRLIVSTGNWTRQTLEESLDLAWAIEVNSEMLQQTDSVAQLACADIKAAYGLLKWLEKHFDTRLLTPQPQGALQSAASAAQLHHEWVDSCIHLCIKMAKGKPRFFDNRNESLLAQLPAQIQTLGGGAARNYLAMGSGFYEAVRTQDGKPKVPGQIIQKLKDAALLTKKPEIDLFVNPQACQAIATSVTALNEQGVTIRPAAQPASVFGKGKPRTLHAKFLFSANERANSSACNNAWVYLGSGNLTTPGFAKKMSAEGGNLEAGVVFAPEGLHWFQSDDIKARQVVSNLLPIQWEQDASGNLASLQAGAGMEPRSPSYIAPPLAWLNWWEGADGNELHAAEAVSGDFVVLDLAGNACQRSKTGFSWFAPQPRQVRCRWSIAGQHHEGDLPVVDGFGRIAASQLPAIGLDEAVWQLADFPLPPGGDEIDEGDGIGGEDSVMNTKRTSAGSSSYPIRQMMELIESIAAKQTEVSELDWNLWCQRLEQTLGQAKECPVVKAFQELGLNPLSPLRYAAFRPAYAETSTSQEGKRYEAALARIEKNWGVDHLKTIGGRHEA